MYFLKFRLIFGLLLLFFSSKAQDTAIYQLRLDAPLLDLPQNKDLPYFAPSSYQALEWSNDFYELGFWGIDKLGDKIFIPKTKPYKRSRKIWNGVFKYGTGLLFSRYASELPIPLGVWAHEEYHKAVLGVNGISAKNGNWMMNRWDGTVYGVSDSSLNNIKAFEPDQLLYSYVAGVHYEIALNEKTTLNDFYKKRTLAKNALLLYNAYYVYNYFKFSVSSLSDSVKVLAPPYESSKPEERDYAGADLTAWAYDMFNPKEAFISRDSFPGGEGVNRRIGFSDLSPEAQNFLVKQKNLSLLNFLNPALFFVNRIKLSSNFSFNAFAQYAPTHFGNAISLVVPMQYKKYDLLLNLTNYANKNSGGLAIGVGLYNYKWSERLESDISASFWQQPRSFLDDTNINGGSLSLKGRYYFKTNFAGYMAVMAKTKGWAMSNPYLNSNLSFQLGLNYNLPFN